MSKHFRPWNIDQTLLLPPNVRDFVPKDHVSRFIVELVRESLDLKAIMCSYVSGLGQPPFDPRMMVSLLLHGYASGLYSSRRIARACCERNDFVMIVALDPPDFRTISDFRKRHLKALGELFLQVLKLCETAGLVKLERKASSKPITHRQPSTQRPRSLSRTNSRSAAAIRANWCPWSKPCKVAFEQPKFCSTHSRIERQVLEDSPGADLIPDPPGTHHPCDSLSLEELRRADADVSSDKPPR